MNFCGMDHGHVLDMESAIKTLPNSAIVANSFQCVGCVKIVDDDDDDDDDDDEFLDVQNVLSPISSDSSDEEETELTKHTTKKNLEPARTALDNIQQTMEDTSRDSIIVNGLFNVDNIRVNTTVEPSLPLNQTSRATSPSNRKSLVLDTPSPCLLNPLTSSQWVETQNGIEITRPEFLCPILDMAAATSPSHEALIQRLELGFRVRPINGPKLFDSSRIETTTAINNDYVSLYLHPDRSRLCFESSETLHRQQQQQQQQQRSTLTNVIRNGFRTVHENDNHPPMTTMEGGWIEIPVADILRLEIGGRNSKSFSIVTEKESGFLTCFNFEALCVIDREIIVSTLMLLLDAIHNSQQSENDDTAFDWIEGVGTMDKPIPCSPSLDEAIEFTDEFLQQDQTIICSPSLETERAQNSFQRTPKQRRSGIFNSAEKIETDTGLVIHLEDISMSDSNISRVLGEWSRRASSSVCLHQKGISRSDEVLDEVRLDCKPSASSTQIGICPNNTSNIAPTVWCSGDTCALALNDIAETCTGIFALKQNESVCAPALGAEQRVAVEEFIATALGTSSVVYSYITEGGADIWNSKSSLPTHDSKDNKITRNRASLLNAQAIRLRGLRNEMTFAAALKQSKEKMQFVQTVQSFDDAYTRAAGTKKLRAATEAANLLHSSPLLQSIVSRMKMHDTDGNSKPEEIVVYYDSDPEDSRPRNVNRGPRKVAADRQLRELDSTNVDRPKALSGIGMEDIGTSMKISRKLDEETIVEIVQVSRAW
jgi:hypothetical protein